MLNKYKFTDTDTEFLCFSDNEIEFPKNIPVECVEENVSPSEYGDLPLVNFEDLLYRGLHQRTRTDDKILAENNCDTFNKLSASYFLIKNKQLNKPKSVRDVIEKRYGTVIHYISLGGSSDAPGREGEGQ